MKVAKYNLQKNEDLIAPGVERKRIIITQCYTEGQVR